MSASNDREQVAADLISIPNAAIRIGLSAETVYRLARAGQFEPAIRVGARWLVSVPRLERFLHGDAKVASRASTFGVYSSLPPR
jgi:predicted DNA-binding transcriptional regulator AlpA